MLLNPALVATAALVWLLVLFAIARHGDRHAARYARAWPLVYALSLGVYCTAWTFYGTVAQAGRWGVGIPPTFIGTIALFLFAAPFLARLAEIARAENATTLADLVAARLGKHAGLAATITAVAVLGMVPYVALQLKAVATSYAMLTGAGAEAPAWRDAAFWVAVTMAVFAMLFGTRRASAVEHDRGLVLAIAAESVFKLAAMLAVGAWVVFGAHDGIDALTARAAALPPAGPDGAFVALVGLGALAMFTLPHQFHVGTVEMSSTRELGFARIAFPIYLVLIALPMLPLWWAGRLAFGDAVPADLFVLALPLSAGQEGLALATFLGGASAASGMVIVAAVTLSLMVANHWLAPWLVRGTTDAAPSDLRGTVLAQRRLAIAGVLALAYAYSVAMGNSAALADIGASSFAALAQLAPAVVAAAYFPGAHARAMLAGIVAGTLAWAWLSLVPVAQSAGLVSLADWPAALSWLLPDRFLGLGGLDPFARAVLVSLALNVAATLAAARAPRAPDETTAATLTVSRLAALASRFVPRVQLDALLGARHADAIASADEIARVERELAAVIGAASARLLVDAAQRGAQAPLDAVAALVGEASQALRFNQRLLEAALENMSQGISVVDPSLALVAWNRRYEQLFGYPTGMLRVGVPVAELVRHNLARRYDGDALEREVGKRLAHMRTGTPYATQRRFGDAIVEIRGNPMPGGGFVATFTDVSEFHRAEQALREAAQTLEQRVAERTTDSEAARAEAERANRAKTRFLAAVGHDLLQPIHAAHLFTHALAQQARGSAYSDEVAQIDGALSSAESLLASLLDISRLDAGGMTAQVQPFALGEVLRHLAAEYGALARERGLELTHVPTRAWATSDPQLLRRVLGNFLSNAIRYTPRGRVLLGCRRRGDALSIEVWDTGPGIAEADRALIFEEFRRLARGGTGLGLGLAIAQRIARLLGHPLALRSEPGRGTMFAVTVPRAEPGRTAVARSERAARAAP
ncbi:MAG TPA: PAS-domain containing protein, partial [Xanthomonadales bacterium]|nr:PAS-domain containing protein [Xanthomonadales bacterium]